MLAEIYTKKGALRRKIYCFPLYFEFFVCYNYFTESVLILMEVLYGSRCFRWMRNVRCLRCRLPRFCNFRRRYQVRCWSRRLHRLRRLRRRLPYRRDQIRRIIGKKSKAERFVPPSFFGLFILHCAKSLYAAHNSARKACIRCLLCRQTCMRRINSRVGFWVLNFLRGAPFYYECWT